MAFAIIGCGFCCFASSENKGAFGPLTLSFIKTLVSVEFLMSFNAP